MKKVLLTTTALVMTAGVAAAEVSMSGTTQVSISATGNAENTLNTHMDFNVSVSGASDNGMTMSTGFGYDAGQQVDAGDFEVDAVETGWGTAAPNMTIGYAGYTFTVDGLGVADLYNGDVNAGELGISGAMGDLSFAATTNVQGASQSSYKVGYAMGDLSMTLTGSTDGKSANGDQATTKLALSYAMGDTTLTASSDDVDSNAEAITKIGVSTKMDAITLSYSAASTGAAGSSVGDDWDASVSYSAGALTASFAVDEDDVTKLSASYDLGGGASMFAVMKSGAANDGTEDFQAVGINFAF